MRIFLLLIGGITLLFCHSSCEVKTKGKINSNICPNAIISLELGNEDSNKIGLPVDGSFEIGPTAMVLDSNNIFFIDPLNSKIRAICLNDKNILSSVSFSTITNCKYKWIPWLNDLALFNNNLYVLSHTDSILILNKELDLIKTLKININGLMQFYKVLNDTLQVYSINEKKIISIDSNDNLSYNSIDSPSILKRINNSYLGFDYKIIDSQNNNGKIIVKTEFGDLELNESIQDITLSYYQCKNIAFNSNYFAHFSINREKNEIIFYLYCYL